MGWDAPWHWVIIAVLVIALFGYKKLPDASRSLGRSLRIFKTEIKGLSEDDKTREAAAAPVVVADATVPVTTPVAAVAPVVAAAPVAAAAPVHDAAPVHAAAPVEPAAPVVVVPAPVSETAPSTPPAAH